MITASFFLSVEFYVMAAVAAAAVIGLCVKPASKGPASTHLLPGILCCDTDATGPQAPELHFRCAADGTVMLSRCGLSGITDSGAVSLAVTKTGFDLSIEERIVPADGGEPINMVLFTLDFLGQERYHIRYNSEPTGLFATFTLTNIPDMEITKLLKVNS